MFLEIHVNHLLVVQMQSVELLATPILAHV